MYYVRRSIMNIRKEEYHDFLAAKDDNDNVTL